MQEVNIDDPTSWIGGTASHVFLDEHHIYQLTVEMLNDPIFNNCVDILLQKIMNITSKMLTNLFFKENGNKRITIGEILNFLACEEGPNNF